MRPPPVADEGSKKEGQRSIKWSRQSANILLDTATGKAARCMIALLWYPKSAVARFLAADFDHGHSLNSLFLPQAALASLPYVPFPPILLDKQKYWPSETDTPSSSSMGISAWENFQLPHLLHKFSFFAILPFRGISKHLILC